MTKNYIKENDCDTIALTLDDEVWFYTEDDRVIDEWVSLGTGYSWFPVVYE